MTFPFPKLVRFFTTWLQAFGAYTATSNNSGWSGYTFRMVLPASQTAAARGGNRARVTLSPPSAGNNSVLDAVYIGHAATGYSITAPSFDGNQKQLFFSGSASVTLTAGGGDTVSDAITFNYDKTRDVIVSFHFSATSDARQFGSLNAAIMGSYKAAVSEAGTTTVSGYTQLSANGTLHVVKGVEIFG